MNTEELIGFDFNLACSVLVPEFSGWFAIHVPGAPVPWSTPDVMTGTKKGGGRWRHAKKDARLIRWQAKVKEAAQEEWHREPAVGPIYLELLFVIETDKKELWGTPSVPESEWVEHQDRLKFRGKRLPDVTNLSKAVEDALSGVCYHDDTQVRMKTECCVWGRSPGCAIAVNYN